MAPLAKNGGPQKKSWIAIATAALFIVGFVAAAAFGDDGGGSTSTSGSTETATLSPSATTDTTSTSTSSTSTTDTTTASTTTPALAPTLSTNQKTYQPGDTVTVSGANWTAGVPVHLHVSHNGTSSWSYDKDLVAAADGTISDSFALPLSFASTFTATASDATGASASAAFSDTYSGSPVPYIVTFGSGTSESDQSSEITAAGGTDTGSIPPLSMHSITFPSGTAQAGVSALAADSNVVRVEQDHSRDTAGTPNDPEYGQQWSLPRIGWDNVYGPVSPAGTATVAILDTGIDASHSDLAGKVIPGTNAITGSGDGESDPNGHGTEIAGVVAAATNNGTGIAGIGYAGVQIMPITVLNDQGLGYDSDVISGVVYAVQHHADVILMAFSNPGYSASLQQAIDWAWSQGAVLVAATGNDGSNTVNYPAGDRAVVGVGNTDSNDNLNASSNTGADVFLAAPGTNILTTAPGGGFSSITGTSAAAAAVAGAAALIKASSVGASNGVIVYRLAADADAIGNATQTGNGRLDLERAVYDTSSTSIEPAGAAPVGDGGPYVGPYTAAAKHSTTTNVSCSSPVLIGVASSCTATVTDTSGSGTTTPTGTVDFTASGASVSPTSPSCTLVSASSRSATCSTSFTGGATGTISVAASYGGDGGSNGHGASTGSASITVNTRATTTAVTCAGPVVVGVASSCTVTVADNSPGTATTPTGTVSFTASGGSVSPTSASCTLNAGSCSTSFTGGSAGTVSVSASYGGDGTHNTSSGSGSVTVNKRSTSTAVSCTAPIGVGASSSCAVTVSDTSSGTATTPTGSVSFTASGGGVSPTSASCTLSAGSCATSFTGGSAGTVSVSASYGGDGTHSTSSGSASITVKRATSTSVGCTSPVIVGQASSCTITVSDTGSGANTPTGTVSLAASGAGVSPTSMSCTLSGNGNSPSCSASFTGSSAGTINVSAGYPGDTNHAASSGSGSATVNTQSPTSLAVSSATGTYGGTVTLSATLTSGGSGVSGKSISFTLNGASAGSASTNTSGVATVSGVSLSGINVGTYSAGVGAAFAGDTNYLASSGSNSLTVSKADQTITFTSTAPTSAVVGSTYTPTATASSGLTVTFSTSGGNCSYSAGVVTMTHAGTCTVTADQAGNSNYNAAPEQTQSFTVGKANQTITFTSTAPTSAVVGSTYLPTASTSSGLSVTFDTSGGNCTYDNGTGLVTMTHAGTCTVTADQAGNSDHNAAPQATESFAVGKANQTITFGVLADKTFGDADFTVSASASSGLAVSFAAGGNCTVSSATVHITGAGTCTITASQPGDADFNAPAGVPQSFSIAKANQTISVTTHAPSSAVYSASFTVAATGGGSGNDVTFSSSGACTNSGATFTMTSGTGTCTVKDDQAGNADYNDAPQVTEDVAASKADQTISLGTSASATAVYGTHFTVAATASSHLDVSYSSSGACSNSGATFTMTSGTGTCTVAYDQAGNDNYNAAPQVTEPVTAAKADQAITVTSHAPSTATYNATFVVAASGGGSGNPVTFHSSGVCSNSDATFTMTSGTGTCTVAYDQAGNDNYSAAPQVTEQVTAQKADQTISFAALADKTYGDADFGVSATATSGLPVSFSVGASDQCTIRGATVHITGAGSCTVTAHQAGDGNYNAAADVPRSFSIAKADQTISFAALPNKTYGDVDFMVSATSSSGLTVTFTALGNCRVSLAGLVRIIGAGSCTITAAQAGDANYKPAPSIPQAFTINKADETISFAALADKTYGDADFTVSATASSGLVVGFAASGNCSLSGSTVHIAGAGSCTITASQGGDSNYNAAPNAARTFSIAKANQSITFGALPDKTYGDPDFTVSATASSGLTIGFAASGTCTVGGSTVHITGAGTCTITASQPGNGNYNAAPDVARTFAINKANQTITFGALADKTYGNADFTVSATASSGLTVSFDASGNCTVSGNTVHLTGAGNCTVAASQAGNSNYNAAADVSRTFAIAKAALTVTADNQTRQYSDSNPTFTVHYSAFVNPDGPSSLGGTLSCTSAAPSAAPGAYAIVCSGLTSANYAITFVNGMLTVKQEDARAYYTGGTLFWGTSTSASSATATLAATIKDISAVSGDPAYDPYAGDIRNAKVTFVDRGTGATLCTASVGLVSSTDTTVGTATCNANLSIGNSGASQYTIGTVVSSYYTRNASDDNTVIDVADPLASNFITGGGFLTLSSSGGIYAGDAGAKNNSGFNVKYNQSGTNLQGNINTIVRREGHVYQIKGNSMTSLSVKLCNTSGCPSATSPTTATFNGRASIQDITDPTNPISIDGNATIQVTMTDKGSPGSSDTIGITVWNKSGGLWFSSNWNGTTTVEQLLGGGDLFAH